LEWFLFLAANKPNKREQDEDNKSFERISGKTFGIRQWLGGLSCRPELLPGVPFSQLYF